MNEMASLAEKAKTEEMTNKQIKAACFEAGIGNDGYRVVREMIGKPIKKETKKEMPVYIPPQPGPTNRPTPNGTVPLKYPANDSLSGLPIKVGTQVISLKIGGQWDFTAEPIDRTDFRKLREAMLISLDPEEGGLNGQLDHEDYYILAEFGEKYEHVRLMIGCNVPGLDK